MSMTVDEFVEKWTKSELKETASFQSFFDDLCRVVEHELPTVLDPVGDVFTFEKFVIKSSGDRGYADAWFRDHFAWEHKGKHRDLDEAYKQLRDYLDDLYNPPLLVVSDFETIVIHTNFNNTKRTTHRITLQSLSEYLPIIEALFHDPDKLKPDRSEFVNSVYEQPQLDICLQPLSEPLFTSSYGLVRHVGGPCPPMEGSLEIDLVLSNDSWRVARYFKIELEISLQKSSRSEINRHVYIVSAGWIQARSSEDFVVYQYIGTADDVCLQKDSLTVGTIEFACELPLEATNVREWEIQLSQDSMGLISGSVFRLSALDHLYPALQQRILDLYGANPAEDLYKMVCKISAEGFKKVVQHFDISIIWTKDSGTINVSQQL